MYNKEELTLSVAAAMEGYREDVAWAKIGERDVTAHIYEYTTQISVTLSKLQKRPRTRPSHIFCFKETNPKKINSYLWFFNALGPILQSNVWVLLGVGMMPGRTSIYHLWKTFDTNSNVGGVCDEIVAPKGQIWRFFSFSIYRR